MNAKIPKLNIAGRPLSWITHEEGAVLYCRDSNMCLYCGDYLYDYELTRDHVVPVSRGGADTWENVVTACRECNHFKADKLLDEIGMRLLAVPYVQNRAEGLILENKNILGDQMEFLKGHASKRNDLPYRQN
jgi:hypothetical protein